MFSKNKQMSLLLGGLLVILISGCGRKETHSNLITSSNTSESSLSITEVTSNNQSTTQQSSLEQTSENGIASIVQRRYSLEEQREISNEFLKWTDVRANIGGIAVNGAYFTHGASGRGDWYAKTTDGQYILVQRQDPNIGIDESIYIAHAIGGVVFYYSNFGTTGLTDEVNNRDNNPSTATGFSQVANMDKPIIKYLLADNGVVYEYNSNVAFSDGFYVTDDEGHFDYWPDEQKPFKESEDKDAQEEFRRILSEYN
ncbi:hypothetical protein PML89_04985 [Vagococcus lutrae]|uniref:hypothetical protein n=1 Tax=Vagococcus lutrae TaxID=81947 RepID=UPI00232DBC55|nr:hypothetical protein [Vagococcus lutrae]WCG04351.1 hypothetical protein PML89_04985 [Vagococcus lutrae]